MTYRTKPRFAGWPLLKGAAGVTLALGGIYLAALALAGLSASPSASDLAVVFGNTVAADGQPSPRLRARLDTALALYRRGMVQRVMVSGGVEQPGDRDEARAMASWLEANGVPRAAIVEDAGGKDTMETARHAATVGGSVIAVTQWFHLPRAMLMMRRFGVRCVSGAWPRFAEARDAYSFLREAVALPFYAVRPIGAGARPAPGAARTPPA
jgi:vancomycin permeability regulator SanA